MRLLIDTNRYSDMIRGDGDVGSRFASAAELWMPIIVMGELLAGFAHGKDRRSNENKLRRFLNKPSTGLLLLDESTASVYGDISNTLRTQGTRIPTNDIWIAALALQHDLTLDTRDQHFHHVPGLKLVASQP
jgi:tRNA(fMet)-specific endonuclease VapC